jgi:EF hand
MEADRDGDGKISFDEFCQMVASTVRTSLRTILIVGCGCQHDSRGCITLFEFWTGWKGCTNTIV